MTTRTTDHDVVIVGARCAGAATAMLLARLGHDVAVLDRATFPSDTLSTHAIARGGMVQLSRWGLLDAVDATGAPRIHTVSFHLPDGSTLGRVVKDRAGVDHLSAPRRYVLDGILQDAAAGAGARIEGEATFLATTRDRSGRVSGVTVRGSDGATRHVRARFVVGADGLRSRVARDVGAATIDERPSHTATRYAYVGGLDATGFEFHIGERRFAGVFPTHGGEANVWVIAPAEDTGAADGDRRAAFLALLESASPALAERVRGARLASPVRGAVRYPNYVRAAAGPGWALVGDAGYHRDPITGHGITDAFRDAELLARQLDRALTGVADEHDALARYADERHRLLAPIFDVTCRLAALPAVDEFVALQKHLSALIEEEATALAALPPLTAAGLVAA